jgi:sugar phosphate isomerase/epimerase
MSSSLEPHDDPERLREAYEEADNIVEAAEQFDAPYRTVHHHLVEHGIHETDDNRNRYKIAGLLEKLDPEDVGLSPLRSHENGGEN